MRRLVISFVAMGLLVSAKVSANDQAIAAIDLSTRYQSSSVGDSGFLNFVGLDLSKDFGNATGDTGELLMQVYVASASNLQRVPGFFDSPDDTPIQFRNFYFKYKGINRGQTQVKVGHFELPFGLEFRNDTNATLLQYGNQFDPGIKVDWGVSVQGNISNYVYEVALTRGSGNEWKDSGSPYLISGRVGSSEMENIEYGFSWLTGRVSNPAGAVSNRDRIGIDISWFYRNFSLLGQYYVGKNDEITVERALIEANVNYGFDEWLAYGRWQNYSMEQQRDDDRNWFALGVRWEPDARWLLESEYRRDIDAFTGGIKDRVFRSQIRYRF